MNSLKNKKINCKKSTIKRATIDHFRNELRTAESCLNQLIDYIRRPIKQLTNSNHAAFENDPLNGR